MVQFILKRSGVMLLTAICLTFIVFFLTNLAPNLEKLAKSEGNNRMTDSEVISWLDNNGYSRNLFLRYGEWLGVVPGWTREDADGTVRGRCITSTVAVADAPTFCGVVQGDFGFSSVFKEDVLSLIHI